MAGTAGRLLALLGLLQSTPGANATELATRLGVGERTVRSDIARLRGLDYPIEAATGRGGGYQLGVGGRLPPLLLNDDEAVAVAVGLGLLSHVPGVHEAGRAVLTKLDPVLPDRLRHRVRAVHDNLDVGPVNTETNAPAPSVSPALLSDLGLAIRDRAGLRVTYGPDHEPMEIDPYRLVSWQERWYLVARTRPSGQFAAFRADWLTLRTPGAGRFAQSPLPGEDYAAFVLREVASSGWTVHARIRVDAPADEVLARINPTVGVVESLDAEHSVLVTGADTFEIVAVWVGMLGLDFHIDGPAELIEHVIALADRYAKATVQQ